MPLLHGLYDNKPVDQSEIPQDLLNIEDKSRSNPLPWSGQFSPQLVHVLLDKYASPGSIVLDPFIGSGTVLLEAGRIGLAAFGSEINPAAIAMSRLYQFINVPLLERNRYLSHLPLEQQLFGPLASLRSSRITNDQSLKMALTHWARASKDLPRILAELLIVMADFYRPGLSLDRVFALWRKITALVTKLPFSDRPIQAFNADVRDLPLETSSVHLVLTSPPYINVFNYHQRFRASMEALDWDLLRVAQSEFGANRKHRGNRFLTVVQFCLDISQALAELTRVCVQDARLIFVVGRESKVRGTRFFNGEIVSEIAHRSLGMDLILRQERAFLNRYGQKIYEDILHFRLPDSPTFDPGVNEARGVAHQVLTSAYAAAPAESTQDVKQALAEINKVMPSPLFNQRLACADPQTVGN